MTCECQKGIILRQGDDSNALGNSIVFNLNTDLVLTGYKAVFQVGEVRYEWNNITSKRLELRITAEQTATLPVGTTIGGLKIYDNANRPVTVLEIPVRVQPIIVQNED